MWYYNTAIQAAEIEIKPGSPVSDAPIAEMQDFGQKLVRP